eukprot:358390-Chlamydomonas_euryale.AAC.8
MEQQLSGSDTPPPPPPPARPTRRQHRACGDRADRRGSQSSCRVSACEAGDNCCSGSSGRRGALQPAG